MMHKDKQKLTLDEDAWKDNPYYQKDPKMFMILVSYIEKYPIHCCKVISRKYRLRHLPQNTDIIDLMDWIIKVTQQFTFNIEIQTRIYCIMQGIVSINQFPKCKTCGNLIIQNAYTFAKGFLQLQYCSCKCRANNPEFIKSMTADRVARYGSIFGDMKKIVALRIKRRGRRNQSNSIKSSRTRKAFSKERKQEIENKKQATCLKHFGVRYPAQSSEVRKKCRKKHTYDGIQFDSLTEIAFYIWLKDNNISFEYQPKCKFTYEFDGKTWTYFPDFKVNGQYVEIKGDHFFKNGKMICPYRYKNWSNIQYEWICKKFEAKHQCMLSHNVYILTSICYMPFIKYVEDKYGLNYLTQY